VLIDTISSGMTSIGNTPEPSTLIITGLAGILSLRVWQESAALPGVWLLNAVVRILATVGAG
jgi:hypothetical protein